jgi:hypothetical protein
MGEGGLGELNDRRADARCEQKPVDVKLRH